jgi:hypothetical protein
MAVYTEMVMASARIFSKNGPMKSWFGKIQESDADLKI